MRGESGMIEKRALGGRPDSRRLCKGSRDAAPRRAVVPLGKRTECGRGVANGVEPSEGIDSRIPGFRVLCSLSERVRGLKCAEDSDAHVVLVPCRDIHTFGMDAAIDVAFVGGDGIVLSVHREVSPGRRIRCAEARMVVERRAHAGRWFECGDCLFDANFGEGGRQASRRSKDGCEIQGSDAR